MKRLWLTMLLLALATLIACRDGQVNDNSSETTGAQTDVVTYRMPGGDRVAQFAAGELSLVEADGSSQVLLDDVQVTGASWFASGEALAFTADEGNGTFHLGVVDLTTGERHTVQTFSEPVQAPAVSGSGNFLSLLVGTGSEADCRVDTRLQVLILDDEYVFVAAYDLADFNGAPVDDAFPLYPIASGHWVDGSTLSVWLEAPCPEEAESAGAPLPGGFLLNAGLVQMQRLDSSP